MFSHVHTCRRRLSFLQLQALPQHHTFRGCGRRWAVHLCRYWSTWEEWGRRCIQLFYLWQSLIGETLPIPPPEDKAGFATAVPFVFVGDEAFPLRNNLLRPYPGNHTLNERRTVYNYRLSRARRVVENAFGILANRFRLFRRPIISSVEKTTKFVKAATVLHNFLKLNSSACGTSQSKTDSFEMNKMSWKSSNNYTQEAAQTRENFCDYFNSNVGAVPWQLDIVRRDR